MNFAVRTSAPIAKSLPCAAIIASAISRQLNEEGVFRPVFLAQSRLGRRMRRTLSGSLDPDRSSSRIPRTSVFSGRRLLSNSSRDVLSHSRSATRRSMLVLERLDAQSPFRQFRSAPAPSRRPRANIAQGAFELDVRAAPRTFVFQLHAIVVESSLRSVCACASIRSRARSVRRLPRSHLWPRPLRSR